METKDLSIKGDTILKIIVDRSQENDAMTIWTDSGFRYVMTHFQDCCESVDIDDISGDLNDLIESPLLQAEVSRSNEDDPYTDHKYNDYESYTWTYYRFATIKGYVTIKWFGTSNGYYSEYVSFDGHKDEETCHKIKVELRDKKLNKLIK